MNGHRRQCPPPPPSVLKCASWGETGKMLTNFIFNLPFCRRACRSGIASSEISSPLSWKHIGAEFASCRPPLPSAAIILRPHPALWPGPACQERGPVQNQKVALFNSGHRHTSLNHNPTTLHSPSLPCPHLSPPMPTTQTLHIHTIHFFFTTMHIMHVARVWLTSS